MNTPFFFYLRVSDCRVATIYHVWSERIYNTERSLFVLSLFLYCSPPPIFVRGRFESESSVDVHTRRRKDSAVAVECVCGCKDSMSCDTPTDCARKKIVIIYYEPHLTRGSTAC